MFHCGLWVCGMQLASLSYKLFVLLFILRDPGLHSLSFFNVQCQRTKLEQITNQFEGQQVNCIQFFLIGSSVSGNDIFALKRINIVFWD